MNQSCSAWWRCYSPINTEVCRIMHTSSTLTSFHISNHYRFVDIFRCTIPFKKTFRNTRIYSPSCAKKTYHCIEVFVWSFCKNTFLHYFFFFLLSNMMCILCVRWYLLSPITPLKYLTGPKEKRLDTTIRRELYFQLHMIQMLYDGQSAREDVPFLSDF